MVVGFNHNIRHGGELYHVQTEDGGLKNPFIMTHLYRGGTILASKKTSYADIIKIDDLDRVVEDLMKEQHKEMLRRLKDGEFDTLIAQRCGAKVVEQEQERFAPKEAAALRSTPSGEATAAEVASQAPQASSRTPEPDKKDALPTVQESSLDDLILSYLSDKDH
jgi:hypothetical protein